MTLKSESAVLKSDLNHLLPPRSWAIYLDYKSLMSISKSCNDI